MRRNFFNQITSIENLLLAWREFRNGKRKKKDVQEFELHLMDNIISLRDDLKLKTYIHGGYHAFNISDPKPRNIHKASVRDRLLHHAIYRVLYPYFDLKFIHDSYSCRNYKGTHRAIERLKFFARKVSKNNTKQCFALKCDIRKFFASIDHQTLISILKSHNLDDQTVNLLSTLISSFHCSILQNTTMKIGLPLGNLTSQLLVNVYMNEFDQYMKHTLKERYYIRYADDFVILASNKNHLCNLLQHIILNLRDNLKLTLHPNKIHIKTFSSGIDFLGWVNFPTHRVLRTTTKRRMVKRLKTNPKEETIQSYLGLLKHGDTYNLSKLLFL
jgi:RNA-directed DNA polymerase